MSNRHADETFSMTDTTRKANLERTKIRLQKALLLIDAMLEEPDEPFDAAEHPIVVIFLLEKIGLIEISDLDAREPPRIIAITKV